MEYYDAGCVNNVLDDLGRVGSIKTKLEIMFKIINGLRFLRDIKIVHMDLKF
jgi:serine/threonine protein kinase